MVCNDGFLEIKYLLLKQCYPIFFFKDEITHSLLHKLNVKIISNKKKAALLKVNWCIYKLKLEI